MKSEVGLVLRCVNAPDQARPEKELFYIFVTFP